LSSSARPPVAFVDVETTGGHPAWHRITEIAIVGMADGEVEWRWSTLVNPGVGIPPSIQRLTGISDEMVCTAPTFAELVPEITRRLEGRRFVAHNARFDYGFVRAEMRRAGHHFVAPLACTVRLSRELFPDAGRHNLDSLIERHGLVCESRHRALPDADVLAQFWRVLLREVEPAAFAAALDKVGRRPSLPAHLPEDLPDELPEAAGVYRFYGEGDALIYVGKANNLRERVLSHFSGATRDAKSQRLSAQVRRLEWTETAGELGALLLESRLVRELQPVYNRKLRGNSETWTWHFADEAAAPELLSLDGAVPAQGDAFGLYKTARQARTALVNAARDARLCLRVLGLETGGEGSCFARQLGKCTGACVGEEPLARHALRVKLALAPFKIKSWPYRGPIVIEERSAQDVLHWHVIDGWQYLGTVVPGLDESSIDTPRSGFDADVYRILGRHLKNGARRVKPWPGLNAARAGSE
jgi:DNA polymerase-3 subunit epsilon